MLELALDARERTGGRFDPTVHDALVAAGYDRSFELVAPESGERPRPRRARPAAASALDGARIELDPGVHVDLGGIAKGYAAERAAELLALAGPCLVNAGGDIAIRGGRWPVGVETADGLADARARRAAGSPPPAATGGTGGAAGVEQHHLIDPRTGAPAETRPAPRDGDRRATRSRPRSRRSRSSSPAPSARVAEADAAGSPRCSSPPTAARLFTGALAA